MLQIRQLAFEGGNGAAPAAGFLQESEPGFVVFEGAGRAAHNVMDRGAGGALVRGDLREGPVVAQVEVEDLALVIRQEGAVAVVEGQGAIPGLEGVKGHALTAYQVGKEG